MTIAVSVRSRVAAGQRLVLVGRYVVDEPADDALTEGGVVDGVQDECVPAVVDQLARHEGLAGLLTGRGDERGGLADDAVCGCLADLRVVGHDTAGEPCGYLGVDQSEGVGGAHGTL
ncbi:hypothetical protein [Streptomyces mirabilis]|uniref:hypothetical protein n=1 Tax=Streptomyces mirabilis TaxID=68239 RepID=UPI003320B8FB